MGNATSLMLGLPLTLWRVGRESTRFFPFASISSSPRAPCNSRRRIVRLSTAWMATGKTLRCVLFQSHRGQIARRVCGWRSFLYERKTKETPCLSNRSSRDLHILRGSTTSRSRHLWRTWPAPDSSECNATAPEDKRLSDKESPCSALEKDARHGDDEN